MVAGFKNHQAKRQCSQDFVVLDFANHKCLRACQCGSSITLAVGAGRDGNSGFTIRGMGGDRVLIINEGSIVANGTPEQLQQQFHGAESVTVELRTDGADQKTAAPDRGLLGAAGEAATALRPAGIAVIAGKRYDVLAAGGEWIVAGAAIRVCALRDGQIHVCAADAPP